MMAYSYKPISEITETSDMSVMRQLPHFFAAIGWGSLVGTAALMGSLLWMEGGDISPGSLFGGIVFLGVFVSAFTLAGMLLIGVPLTLMFSAIECEAAWLYSTMGAIGGFVFLALLFGSPGSVNSMLFAFAGPGALAGFAAASRWGLWRERQAAAQRPEHRNSQSPKRDNPIHDLIH